MITGKGVGFVAAAIIIFLLAGLTQVGWLYLMDAVLWGIILLSAGFPWLGTAFVTAQRRVVSPKSTRGIPGPAEGDKVQITLSVRARALWPSYVLSLFYECPVAGPVHSLCRYFVTKVTRSSQASMVSTVEAYQRGAHCLGPVLAESSAPFGLFRRRVPLTDSQEILVYPTVIPLDRLAMADGLRGMAFPSRTSRTGTEPVGSRPYLKGDPWRLIHWRNTARKGLLMVKEFEDAGDRTLHLLFDANRVWGKGKETTLEYGIEVVASVAHYAHRNQVPVRVLGGDLASHGNSSGRGDAWQSPLSWTQLLHGLALVAPGDGVELPESLARLPFGASALVVVSPNCRRAMQAIAQSSSTAHRIVVVSLEGFGELEPDSGDQKLLRAAGVQMISCRPGQLREALRSLENMVGPAWSPVRAATQAGYKGSQLSPDSFDGENLAEEFPKRSLGSNQLPTTFPTPYAPEQV